jgi:RNA polymerase sigma-70 factor (ECF subfamily)
MNELQPELERLFDRYGRQFFCCALAVTGCRETAEDAIQDAFCRILRLRPEVVNLKAYLFRCIRSAAIDLVRKENRHMAWSATELFEYTDAVADADEQQYLLGKIAGELKRLSPDEREVILQHLVGGMTYSDIAELLGRPLGTVTAWYRRGLKKLQDNVKDLT